jgi:hypothetical protein
VNAATIDDYIPAVNPLTDPVVETLFVTQDFVASVTYSCPALSDLTLFHFTLIYDFSVMIVTFTPHPYFSCQKGSIFLYPFISPLG